MNDDRPDPIEPKSPAAHLAPACERDRLDQVEEDVQRARKDGDEVAHGILYSEEHFTDSGTVHPELDDQTIVPPG
ncbi:MAG: hypothetical protein ACYDAD_08730 [Acidimicrobiales bacterium]